MEKSAFAELQQALDVLGGKEPQHEPFVPGDHGPEKQDAEGCPCECGAEHHSRCEGAQ